MFELTVTQMFILRKWNYAILFLVRELLGMIKNNSLQLMAITIKMPMYAIRAVLGLWTGLHVYTGYTTWGNALWQRSRETTVNRLSLDTG